MRLAPLTVSVISMRKANNNDHEYGNQAGTNKTKCIKEYANSFDNNKMVQNIESLMSDIDFGCGGGISRNIKA